MQDAKNLRRKDKRVGWIFAIAITGLLLLAYIDGGEEAVHPITQPVAVPEGFR